MRSIEPFTRRKVVVLHEDATLLQAARAMCDNQIGCVVVANHGGHIVGILTDRDIVCGFVGSLYSVDSSLSLSEVMTSNVGSVDENSNLDDAIVLMQDRGVRRIPVVKRDSANQPHCIGIIALDDLLASQSIDPLSVAKIVQAQILRHSRLLIPPGMRKVLSESRSQKHMEQTLKRFYKVIAQETGLELDVVPTLTKTILGTLTRRLTYSGAANFIAQLPRILQNELLTLPAGPDRSITINTFESAVMNNCTLTKEDAHSVLFRFFHALRKLVNPKELEHVKAQLPQKMQVLIEESANRAA